MFRAFQPLARPLQHALHDAQGALHDPRSNHPQPEALDRLWFTRCPVPTASGIAYKLGWLQEEFARDGLPIDTLQEARQLGHHHYDHLLPGLFREGGNLPALAARAAGAPSRLVGLTWIEEWQTLLVRPDSNIRRPEDLRGKRLALPAWGATALAASPGP